ncbi:hypothetical protein FEM41_04115 [Jejubacter calystegiae]|uniref:OmpA-like domain-containing protein n=1 Tax=Jejubacter calystegiae TaxID=2579935 RepID=A0A4P8YKD5_9ENTR|nr:OmpA family protein [Jejubacter calystegiae]QCT18892.1 hypothetical protein FEM41_04115 [Jejubacter calystegiae]
MHKLSVKLLMVAMILSCSLALVTETAWSADGNALEKIYQGVPDVNPDQAQVVYFRSASVNIQDQNNANIYVDGEFQTALIPGSYSIFCLRPGVHVLGSWLKDEPGYAGKQQRQSKVPLEGGKTYFFVVDEDMGSSLHMLKKREATPLLMKTRLQDVLVSRASEVTRCQYLYTDYVLSGDVLFDFGKYAEQNIKTGGRSEISDVAGNLINKSHAKVMVIGHTDPIGSEQSNLDLGFRRASTVKALLMSAGLAGHDISVMTTGSQEPVASGCEGLERRQKIMCYAPDRRVVIRSYNK